MTSVLFSPLAISDLEGIWDYTVENWGLEKAAQYTDRIRDACSDLAVGRKQGRPVPLRDGYFKYPVNRHFIFFMVTENGIAVIRILHQQMDVEAHLQVQNAP